MTRRLVVHAGTYKTGTSRIQALAWKHRAALLEQGWLYPLAGLRTDDPDVGVRHSELAYRRPADDPWPAAVAALVAEVAASPAHSVLLSTEAWSRPSTLDTLEAVVTALRAAGAIDTVEVVLYLRPRVEYARALYREFTRRRANRLPFPAYVARNRRALDLLETLTSLQATMAAHRGVLTLHPYARVGDVGPHLMESLGIELPVADDAAPHVINRGVSAVDAEAMRWINLLAPELTAAWPLGSSALEADDLAESLPDGLLATTPQWRAAFAAATGWDDADVDRVCAPAASYRPVEALEDALQSEARRWIEAHSDVEARVVVYPHEAVEVFEVRPVEVSDTASKPWISGVLLMRPGHDGWRLVGVDPYREREVTGGRPSPGLARRRPDRRDAAQARWGTGHLEFGLHGRIELHLVHDDGRRGVLAEIRRVRRPLT